MPSSQVKFYKGTLSVYQAAPSLYTDGIFFDTTNNEIYLNGSKFSERRWSQLNDASVIVVDSVPMLGLDIEDYLGSVPLYVRLFKVEGKNAITTSVDSKTGDVSVGLTIDNTGNTKTWLTQSGNGLKFSENTLAGHKVNNKGILTNPWLTAADVSVGTTPSVSDSNLTIATSDTVALALQKVKRIAEINAIKYITIANSSGTTKANLNSGAKLDTLIIQDGSYIDITHPSGSDNKIVISTTLQAGDNITISNDGKINAEGGTYWMEID